eukprot:SAG31_NODE_2888_length_4948_cov_2.055475_7_plen_228_part_00
MSASLRHVKMERVALILIFNTRAIALLDGAVTTAVKTLMSVPQSRAFVPWPALTPSTHSRALANEGGLVPSAMLMLMIAPAHLVPTEESAQMALISLPVIVSLVGPARTVALESTSVCRLLAETAASAQIWLTSMSADAILVGPVRIVQRTLTSACLDLVRMTAYVQMMWLPTTAAAGLAGPVTTARQTSMTVQARHAPMSQAAAMTYRHMLATAGLVGLVTTVKKI